MILRKLIGGWLRKRPRVRCSSVPVIGTMATMPTRRESLRRMLGSILPQLDLLYVFLDGYTEVPDFLAGRPDCRVEVVASPGLHNASRFLAPIRHGSNAYFLFLDDDLIYPPDYADRLVDGLLRYHNRVIVGYHGTVFTPPHQGYLRDRTVFHFARELKRDTNVHMLGVGTLAFHSSTIRPDPSSWAQPRLDDFGLAAEAAKAGVEMVALARKVRWLVPITQNQPDSIWNTIRQDDRVATRLMREVLSLHAMARPGEQREEAAGTRARARDRCE
jgi:hypothetical protein